MPKNAGKQQKVVLVSSGQPSANPRLVKEAVALYEAGYSVTVIFCYLSPWADKFDVDLFQQNKGINWVGVGYRQSNRLGYAFARVRQKFFELTYPFVRNANSAIKSLVLFNQELVKETLKHQAGLYIGHNLGALNAVVKAAKKHEALAAFDFEDFHRGEFVAGDHRNEMVSSIERTYVGNLCYASSASPLITKAYQTIFPSIKWLTVNNCFPKSYSIGFLEDLPNKPLKLFWFSQFVGRNRGLEKVIEAIGKFPVGTIQLHLLGNCSSEIREHLENICPPIKNQLVFLAPVPEPQILKIASGCHLGLAVEVPYIENREFCLTNKVFMYLLAGNAVLFSTTAAQSHFLEKYPKIGNSFEWANLDCIVAILDRYLKNPELIFEQRKVSLQLGLTQLNWDIEKMTFLKQVSASLGKA